MLELQYQGLVPTTELLSCINEAITLAEKHQRNRVLTDCQELTGGFHLADLYKEIERLSTAPLPAGMREAIIQAKDPSMQEMVNFWQTACLNRGLNVAVFPDRQTALKWLQA